MEKQCGILQKGGREDLRTAETINAVWPEKIIKNDREVTSGVYNISINENPYI